MSTDRFDRPVTDHGDGTFSVPGIEVTAGDLAQALASLASLAPEGWVDPNAPEPEVPE